MFDAAEADLARRTEAEIKKKTVRRGSIISEGENFFILKDGLRGTKLPESLSGEFRFFEHYKDGIDFYIIQLENWKVFFGVDQSKTSILAFVLCLKRKGSKARLLADLETAWTQIQRPGS